MKKTVLALSLILFLSLFLINDVKADDSGCEDNEYGEKGNGICEKECIYKFKFNNMSCELIFETNFLKPNDRPSFTCTAEMDTTRDCYKYSASGKSYCLSFKIYNYVPDVFVDDSSNRYHCNSVGYYYAFDEDKDYSNVLNFWLSDNTTMFASPDKETTIVTPDSGSDSKPKDETPSYNPYDDIVKCDGANAINSIPSCWCMPAAVADITSFIYGFLRIGGPVLLIILGGIDLGKAIVATDESGIKKAKKKLINKFVAAACIFLVLSVIQMIVNITGGGNYGNLDSSNKNCLYYLLYGYES